MAGAVFGRWWRVPLLVLAVGWPVLAIGTGAMSPGPALAGAAGFAVLNTGAGVPLHQGIRHGGRKVRRALAARRNT
jgi:hypothetical protein